MLGFPTGLGAERLLNTGLHKVFIVTEDILFRKMPIKMNYVTKGHELNRSYITA
jgi:hypothetical protein